MWFTLSVASLLLATGVRLLQKDFVRHNPTMNAFRINWLAFAVSMPVVVVLIAQNIHRIERLSGAFWLVLTAVVLGFYPVVNYLYFSVIRRNELSDVLPLLGLIPIWTALFGWLFLDQHPSRLALTGIIFISASLYSLELQQSKTWYEPFRALTSSYKARAVGVVSLITAVAAIGDKYAIERSSSSIYFALNSLGAIIILVIADLIFSWRQHPKPRYKFEHLPTSQWRLLFYLGLVLLGGQLMGFIASNVTVNTSYTIAIRNLSIVVASLLALVLYRESVNRYKFLCYGLSALGVVMIAL